MVRRYYDLPSLTGLAVFEASARHLSFTLASSELNVTPGAVSRQVKALEEEIGVPLFVRKSKGVALTAAGEELYGVLSGGFARFSEIVQILKRGDRAHNVTIACSDVFGSMWLIPRMPGFWRNSSDITVDHLISDDIKNFRRAEVELRIRYGMGAWIDETAELLFDECLYPVCSPAFAAQYHGAAASDLGTLPLLHIEWVKPDWMGWDEILSRGGVSRPGVQGRRFGKFTVALQAALADQGLVAGWHRLVGPLVEKGQLVRFTDFVIKAPGAYYLTWNSNRELSPAAITLRDWIRELALEERGGPCPPPLITAVSPSKPQG